ncbi:MAG: phosphoenolpyruvate synthase, partial [Betaproteobacteria bacterium]|nr:phosphoenolpyruvate synthase [Betaproteobacteria bacterium]
MKQHLSERLVVSLEALRLTDVDAVGGKNASLGEMISQLAHAGVRVPGGFATTAAAFRDFLAFNQLSDRIAQALSTLNVEDVKALAQCGDTIRRWIVDARLQPALEVAIREAFAALQADEPEPISVAVRSSATAEDLPDASFAGQQESFLNVVGIDLVLLRVRQVYASLYNDRAIAYRVHQGFAQGDVALSVGIQRMVRSDAGAAGVMFTMDTESGFDQVVFITSAYGLGETVVQGAVNPDEFYVFKPLLKEGKPAIVRRSIGSKKIKMVFSDATQAGKSTHTIDVDPKESDSFSLNDEDILELAQYAVTIESHYGCPMDIEWGKNGLDGKIYILQARPETVKSQSKNAVEVFKLKGNGKAIVAGRAVTQKIGVG